MNNVGQSRIRPAPCFREGAQNEFTQFKRIKIIKVNRCDVGFCLEEDPLSDDELSVLYWWKVNIKYPIL